MAITNGYCSLADLKNAIGISDTTDDDDLEDAVEAASRDIDDYCGKGRKFWQDASVVERSYYPSQASRLVVDDISTATGLLVDVDTDDDGSFSTSLTINTDFVLEPVNAAAEFPVRPWTSIRLLGGTLSSWSRLSSGRPYVRVTAKFGWSAVPEQVRRACILQAKTLFKAPDTTFGTFTAGIDGQPQRVPRMDPIAAGRLERYVRFDEVDDGGT